MSGLIGPVALVDFATEGFGALINLSIGLFGLAILSYQIDVATRDTSTGDRSDH